MCGMETFLPLIMFLALFGALLFGYPVAFTIGGVAFLFGVLGIVLGVFDPVFFEILPARIFGLMSNVTLIAVPLFIFMGMVLAKSGLAENLLETLGRAFGKQRGGLAFAVILVGAMLAASTGIVGATVVTMTVIALPLMLRHGYCPKLATGVIASSGTLGQIVPPSIVLILLADVINLPEVATGKLFLAAVGPSILLVGLYVSYILFMAWKNPKSCPALPEKRGERTSVKEVLRVLLPPLLLIGLVLGSIFTGVATPTESAGVGAVGAVFLAWLYGASLPKILREAAQETVRITAMVMMILIAAQAFGLVFRGMDGDDLFRGFLLGLDWSPYALLFLVMLVVFVAGFFLDFVEITYIIVPVMMPVLVQELGFDPLWLAVLLALNLQTSFLTPPLGFSLFYLKGASGNRVKTETIYQGIVPFVLIQLVVIFTVIIFPGLILRSS